MKIKDFISFYSKYKSLAIQTKLHYLSILNIHLLETVAHLDTCKCMFNMQTFVHIFFNQK